MTGLPPVQPGIREVDPEAEIARLTAERADSTAPKTWFVRVDFPDGRCRRFAVSDLLVQSFRGRPETPGASKETVDVVTVLLAAGAEVWATG